MHGLRILRPFSEEGERRDRKRSRCRGGYAPRTADGKYPTREIGAEEGVLSPPVGSLPPYAIVTRMSSSHLGSCGRAASHLAPGSLLALGSSVNMRYGHWHGVCVCGAGGRRGSVPTVQSGIRGVR
eukprot:scaffold15422_cov107-Isochrysis_galbana.AAC.1